MNTTEERLRDALEARARTVHPETLRALAEPMPQPARRRMARAKRYPGWLVPVAAAAAVVIVAVLSVTLGGRPGHPPATPRPDAALPRYYVILHGTDVEARQVASGRIAGTLNLARQLGVRDVSESVTTADGRTFYLNVLGAGQSDPFMPSIYRFHLTADGQIAGFAHVTAIQGGIAVNGRTVLPLQSMAASPDGSKLALALGTEVVVVDVRTGAQAVWRGGFGGQQEAIQVQQVSWTGDGHTLAVLIWRLHPDLGAEVRTLNAAANGGSLASTQLALRWQPSGKRLVEQAVISPDGKTIVAAIWPGSGGQRQPGDEVVQYPIAVGRQSLTLYRGPADPQIHVRGDGSGHWLVIMASKRVLGWIGGGRLHQLPPGQDGTVGDVAW